MTTIKFNTLIRESNLSSEEKDEVTQKNDKTPLFIDEDQKATELAQIILDSPYDSANKSYALLDLIYLKQIKQGDEIEKLKKRLSVVKELINTPSIKHLGDHESHSCACLLEVIRLLSKGNIVENQFQKVRNGIILTSLLIKHKIITCGVSRDPYVSRKGEMDAVRLKDYLLDSKMISEDLVKLMDSRKDFAVGLINGSGNLNEKSKHFFNRLVESNSLDNIVGKEVTTLGKLALQVVAEIAIAQYEVNSKVDEMSTINANQVIQRT